jgi:hypothetical protein
MTKTKHAEGDKIMRNLLSAGDFQQQPGWDEPQSRTSSPYIKIVKKASSSWIISLSSSRWHESLYGTWEKVAEDTEEVRDVIV